MHHVDGFFGRVLFVFAGAVKHTRTAARAVRENHDIRLEPMSANERRIIHSALSEHAKVETESKGNEPNRYVVIKLKNRKDKDDIAKTREDAE